MSIYVYPDMARDYKDNPLFNTQENKNRTFWRSDINLPDDVTLLADAIRRSCLNYERYNPEPDPSGKSTWNNLEGTQSEIEAALHKAWSESDEKKSPEFEDYVDTLGFKPLSNRAITIAGTSHHGSSKALTSGSILRCELEFNNPYDSDAIAFTNDSATVMGYVQKTCSQRDALLVALRIGLQVYAIVSDRKKRTGNRQDRVYAYLLLEQ